MPPSSRDCAQDDRTAHFGGTTKSSRVAGSFSSSSGGVANGTRTHDNQNHNLGLYQLSYSHHRSLRL